MPFVIAELIESEPLQQEFHFVFVLASAQTVYRCSEVKIVGKPAVPLRRHLLDVGDLSPYMGPIAVARSDDKRIRHSAARRAQLTSHDSQYSGLACTVDTDETRDLTLTKLESDIR